MSSFFFLLPWTLSIMILKLYTTWQKSNHFIFYLKKNNLKLSFNQFIKLFCFNHGAIKTSNKISSAELKQVWFMKWLQDWNKFQFQTGTRNLLLVKLSNKKKGRKILATIHQRPDNDKNLNKIRISKIENGISHMQSNKQVFLSPTASNWNGSGLFSIVLKYN
jgi:hypothetical protein